MVAIILHNIVVDIEDESWAKHFIQQHDMAEQPGPDDDAGDDVELLDSVRMGNGEA